MAKALEGKLYEKQLRSFGLLLQKRRLMGILIVGLNILMRARRDVIALVISDRTRENGMKLSWGRFLVDVWKVFHLEQAPQASGHSTKPDRIQKKCWSILFVTCCDSWDSPLHGQDLASMVLMAPIQLSTLWFYDSKIL
ncbi:hypothetical protein HGM15179_003911 [Zosterops borbonicus]|uniref:Uncharacterized protein n=1 Tax=Zosterops borbonicus TaxID=364589 RepID=A0A8K1LQP6_9PASS|nr:hypothetical protein HGM15179_003911 [Zosterops borbonicus]